MRSPQFRKSMVRLQQWGVGLMAMLIGFALAAIGGLGNNAKRDA